MTLVVHPVVEHTDDKDARLIGFEEHAVAATGSHLQARPEVVAVAADDSASEESFHGLAQSRHVLSRAIGTSRPLGIAAYRFQIRAGAAADGATYRASSGLRLPPHVRDLAIEYTALSVAAPEKIRFRHKLEGQDRGWKPALDRPPVARLLHLVGQFNRTVGARVAEPTRIARDLHHTLLQGFHALLFMFESFMRLLPDQTIAFARTAARVVPMLRANGS